MKKIAIIGVDGTGKSTIISKIKERYGDDVKCIYMGCRDFEFEIIHNLNKRQSKIAVIFNVFFVYICFWYRYMKGVFSGKTVIYDRYVHETYINAPGIYHWMFKRLYFNLFPQPTEIIYLYCPFEESLKRKDDIDDPIKFKEMKCRFDRIFLSDTRVHKFDTSIQRPDEIVDSVVQIIRR